MAVKFKQLCSRCKKNYVVVTWRQKFATCYDCQKDDLNGKITDPKMKKMFNVPESFYRDNSFLRDIKARYLRYKNLSEKQIEVFQKVADQMKKDKKESS